MESKEVIFQKFCTFIFTSLKKYFSKTSVTETRGIPPVSVSPPSERRTSPCGDDVRSDKSHELVASCTKTSGLALLGSFCVLHLIGLPRMPPKEKKPQRGKHIRAYLDHEWSVSKDGFFVVFGKGHKSRKEIVAKWVCVDVRNDKNVHAGEEPGYKLNFITELEGKQRVYLDNYTNYKESDSTLDTLMKGDTVEMSKSLIC